MTRKPLAEQMQAAHKAVSGWDGCASAGETASAFRWNSGGAPCGYGGKNAPDASGAFTV